VSLPGLGSFAVGQCVDSLSGAAASKRAPVFMLHEVFNGISQVKGRYFLKASPTYVRVNSLSLAAKCKMHKSAVTYILKVGRCRSAVSKPAYGFSASKLQ